MAGIAQANGGDAVFTGFGDGEVGGKSSTDLTEGVVRIDDCGTGAFA